MDLFVILYIIIVELFIIISIFFFLLIKNKKKDVIFPSNYKNTFNDIVEYTEKAIDTVVSEFYDSEILRNYFKTNDTLGTESINTFVKDIYLTFLNTFPKMEFDYYNKITNNNYEKLVIKLIHKRILKTDLTIKKYHNSNKGKY